jgi:hypothetical protein
MKRRRTNRSPRRSLTRWLRRDEQEARPTEPDLEPTHDQPWVPRSAFTDRLRRSPRR